MKIIQHQTILFCLLYVFCTSCATIGEWRNQYNIQLQQNCEQNLFAFHGNVDLVYGLFSMVSIDCPVFLHGQTIQWNEDEPEMKKDIDTNKNINIQYGKEYGSVFRHN